MTTEEEKVKVKIRLKRHFKKAIDLEKNGENKSRNLPAVFDISLDYWSCLKNYGITDCHSKSSHTQWDKILLSDSRRQFLKQPCASVCVFILLKMKFMGRFIHTKFLAVEAPSLVFFLKSHLILFAALTLSASDSFVFFIFILRFQKLTVSFSLSNSTWSPNVASLFCSTEALVLFMSLPTYAIWRSCKFFCSWSLFSQDTGWIVCWCDLALFCKSVWPAERMRFVLFYFKWRGQSARRILFLTQSMIQSHLKLFLNSHMRDSRNLGKSQESWVWCQFCA